MSVERRAGDEISRYIEQAADPGAVAKHAIEYSKQVYGTTQLFERTSGGVAHQLSGIESNIWDRPSVEHADDDEFDSAVINPAWSFTGGTLGAAPDPYAAFAAGDTRVDVNVKPSWIRFQSPGNNTVNRLSKLIAVPANQLVWMRASFSTRIAVVPADNDGNIGLSYANAANSISIYLNETDAGRISIQFQKFIGGVLTIIQLGFNIWNGAVANGQLYSAVGIQKIGTTYHGWAFTPGGHALHLGSTIEASVFDRVQIVFRNSLITAPGNSIVGVDFVRLRDSAVFLP